jgi:glucuronate isomerase
MVAQFHLGAQRHTSSRLRTLAGAAGGYAGMGSGVDAGSLCALLDEIEKGESGLPKTVLFPLNPADNAMISILSGSFSKDGVAGLITQGPAWWWCDHKQGMEQMLEHNAVFGLLFNFIGMTTDSRSFLSLVRHDYFRRVLCDWLGKKSESGDYPESLEELTELAKLMSYENARNIIEKGV